MQIIWAGDFFRARLLLFTEGQQYQLAEKSKNVAGFAKGKDRGRQMKPTRRFQIIF